jgi:hypothetical protein
MIVRFSLHHASCLEDSKNLTPLAKDRKMNPGKSAQDLRIRHFACMNLQ